MNEIAHNVFSNAHVRFIDEHITEEAPRLKQALYPKRIVPPQGYFNPKWYATSLAVLYRGWRVPENTMLPHTTGAMMALLASKYGLPLYFIQPEFAEAVAQTDPPVDFFLKDIKFPMPALAFVLPDAFVHRYFGYYCPFIGAAQAPKGIYPAAARPFPETELNLRYANDLLVDQERIIFHFPMFHAGAPPTDYTGNYPLESNLSIIEEASCHDATGYEEAIYEAKYGCHYSFPNQGPEGEAEKQFQQKIVFFAIKLLLAITAEPEYIVPGKLQRREKRDRKGRIQQEALWNPNVIGGNFRAVRHSGEPGTGSHASPRWHWRRQRMTYQVVGKRGPDFVYRESLPKDDKGRVDWKQVPEETRLKFWSNHKLLWLKPTLVNAPEAPVDLQKAATSIA